MYIIRVSFFSILLLLAFHVDGLKCMGTNNDMVTVTIERSPSTAVEPALIKALIQHPKAIIHFAKSYNPNVSRPVDMTTFTNYLEFILQKQKPEKPICLDINTALNGTFYRLNRMTPEDQSLWEKHIQEQFKKFTQYNINKLRFKLKTYEHIPFVDAFVYALCKDKPSCIEIDRAY